MTLYLPPQVAAAERKRYTAEILKRVTIEDPRAREFTVLLQRIDPRLFMVKAHDLIAPGTPLRPGYYHVLRRNEGAPMSVFVVEGPDGEFVEPTSRVFDRLAAGDLRNPHVMREMLEQPHRDRERANRNRDADNAIRREVLKERVDAGTRAQVSMDRSIPWTQNSSGRRPKP